MSWEPTSVTVEEWGRIQVVINDIDVTFFRDVPVQGLRWSSGEPFGDAQMSMSFPQITSFDAFGAGELAWLEDWANVDVYHVDDTGSADVDNPLFEGMIASIDDSLGEDGYGITIECIGALYQLDLYVRAPSHVHKPGVHLDELIRHQFDSRSSYNLRTQNLIFDYPVWWAGAGDPDADKHFDADTGRAITGFMTTSTGSWDRVLTGFIQNHLSLLQEDNASHGRIIWTIDHEPHRQPVMRIKDGSTVHWTISAGTPGITHDLSYDLSQAPNTFYGEGTDEAGTKWRNSQEVGVYRPLAIQNEVSPYLDNEFPFGPSNPDFDPHEVRHEVHVNYGDGVSLLQGQQSAAMELKNNEDPGWYGTLTLKVDPEEGSRFRIRAGQNLLYKHFRGSGAAGVKLHIAQVEIDVDNLEARLTVDTKMRDLLTLGQLIERRAENNMDATKMLRAGVQSGITTDERAPWDNYAGAGFMPKASAAMQLERRDPTEVGYRPTDNADLYVFVNASSGASRERWGFAPILVQEYGNISMIRLTAYDSVGNVVAVPFHVGLYGDWLNGSMNVDYMPSDTNSAEKDPFLPGVFDDPSNIDSSRIIMWGQGGQRAGYWPGLESQGDPATGILVDEGGFNYNLPDGESRIWLAIYCQHTSDVWFQGRMWRGND